MASGTTKRVGSFGARACRRMRERILSSGGMNGEYRNGGGWHVLPKSWRRKWMVARIVATPPWVDMREIKMVYEDAARMGWTVGHIVPLNHPYVSGLHVPWNLQPEPAKANFSKGNDFHPDQLSMFENEGQLSLL